MKSLATTHEKRLEDMFTMFLFLLFKEVRRYAPRPSSVICPLSVSKKLSKIGPQLLWNT